MLARDTLAPTVGPSAVHTYLRELAYSLCEQREMPVVVTDLIANYLDEQDLSLISILSRNLNDQANLIIYYHIALDFTDAIQSGRTAALLLRTLLTSRTAANNVRSLSLTGDPLIQWREEAAHGDEAAEIPLRGMSPPEIFIDLSTFNLTEIALYKKMIGSSLAPTQTSDLSLRMPKLCLDIISLTTYLQDLYISSDHFRYPDFRKGLRDIGEAGGLRTLRSSSLCLDVIDSISRHITAVLDWDDALLTPFLAPGIESIAIVTALQPEAVSHLRTTSITRLVLHHCQVQDSDFDSVLAATPQLRYLEYHASVDYNWFKPSWGPGPTPALLELEPLFAALHHVSNALEELVASQEFDEDCIHFHPTYAAEFERPFRPSYELSKMRHLHTLSIPYLSLLGWKPKKGKKCEWHKILPTSLRQITLTDDIDECLINDRWTDESLMPVIKDLLNWLITRKEAIGAPKFALLLRHAWSDFNEPVRQNLFTLCEERGILCAIEKLRKDHV